MTLGAALALGTFVALAAAGLLAGAVTVSGPVDRPRDRGSHRAPTPTSGGLAILAGALLGAAACAWAAPLPGVDAVARLALIASLLGALAAADDLYDLGARAKLVGHVAAALAFSILVARVETLPLGWGLAAPLGPVIGTLGTALFVVVLLNAVNFMDGSNGLAAGAVAVALAGVGYAALRTDHTAAAALAFACAAANLGYLAWNFPGGHLFQGDVGALFSAMVLAGVGVILATPGKGGAAVSPYLVVFAALPLLVDVLLTLAVRMRDRERLLHAHRRHLYQLWLARTGRSHAALAWRVWVLTAATTAVGLILENYAPDARLPVLAITTLFLGLAWAAYRRRLT